MGIFYRVFVICTIIKKLSNTELQANVDALIYLQDWGRQNLIIETYSWIAWDMVQKTQKTMDLHLLAASNLEFA